MPGYHCTPNERLETMLLIRQNGSEFVRHTPSFVSGASRSTSSHLVQE